MLIEYILHVLSSLTQNQLTNNNFQSGHDSLQQHNPSFQTILESVDVRNSLQNSRNRNVGVPLPAFRGVPSDQLSSGSDDIQILGNTITQQNSQFSNNNAGSSAIFPATLIGSTIGEMVSPGAVSFKVADVSIEESDFQNLRGESFEVDDIQTNFQLDNLGQGTFIGESQGNPALSNNLGVSSPQVVGVSLPLQVGVSDPLALGNQNSQQTFIRNSRSQTKVIGTATSDKAKNEVVFDEKRLQKLEQMLQSSFGPEAPKEQTKSTPSSSLVKTADMSKIPLEKHSKTRTPVFPPFSPTNNKEATIEKAVLK